MIDEKRGRGGLPKITELDMISGACPSQWSGELEGGAELYVRYRYGFLRARVDGERIYGEAIDGVFGEGFGEVLETEEMLELTGLRLAEGVAVTESRRLEK